VLLLLSPYIHLFVILLAGHSYYSQNILITKEVLNMPELISIRDAAVLLGKSESLIYRYIRTGKLEVQNCSELIQGKFRTVKKLNKEELIKIFSTPDNTGSGQGSEHRFNTGSGIVQNVDIRGMIEAEATYRLGRLEERYINLEAENSKLIQSLQDLQERIKALPDMSIIAENEQKILTLQGDLKKKDQILHEVDTKLKEAEAKFIEDIQMFKSSAEHEKQSAISELQAKLSHLQKPWWKKLF
jgi:hypothetical protein